MTIEEVLAFDEMQIFDRKSINIDPKALAVTLVAFANADGGTAAIGISDKTRRVEGVDYNVQQLNDLLRVPYDFCEPTVQAAIEKVPCTDYKGRDNHVILMHIEPGPHVYANQADEVPKFVRQEIIVNAVTHRAYSISGTDIQIKMFDDRLVVESPGRLPGLVRADNIRHTHFSRNPKMAEFLRVFNFVKEYGEGVDRMCLEMEAKGLRGPEYHSNAFLLQTVVYNAASKKVQVMSEKLAIGTEKPAIQDKKPAFGNKKLSIEILNRAIEKQHYNEPTKTKIILVYNMIEINQIFGAPEVKGILKCSSSSSKDIMKKLRDMEVVVTVKGKGKGNYRFAYDKEIKK